MTQKELDILLQFFKTLADENRLKIIGLLSHREHSVGELAALLDLKEPTVSHHLARLKTLGLVDVRADGNNRFYRLDRAALGRLNQEIFSTERLTSWVDDIDVDAWDRKVLSDYIHDGKLKQIPTKEKKLIVILRWLITRFEPGRRYTERDVNDIIEGVYDDYAMLRRELVDFGFLARDSGGGGYWIPEDSV
ncbi:MAG: metalloregulator ArsR/SmtB family transcription factor [Anaerolineae bacterium]|nr:metalloregulator ArsR/SmtB family transcription factor [Anaerolineae bacterium]